MRSNFTACITMLESLICAHVNLTLQTVVVLKKLGSEILLARCF